MNLLGQCAQLGRRVDAKLQHHLGALCLYGALTDTELVGDLLVELAGDDTIKDLALTGRKRLDARTQMMSGSAHLSLQLIENKRAFKCIEQGFAFHWLF